MPIPHLTIFTLLLIALVGCNSEPRSTSVDIAAEKAAIMALEKKWSDMFVAGDLDGISALFAEETVLLEPGEAPIVGIGDVRAATQAMLATADVQTSWKSDFVFVSPGGDMAYDYGTSTTKLADGSSVEGRYLAVWIKEDGGWKVAAEMFN